MNVAASTSFAEAESARLVRHFAVVDRELRARSTARLDRLRRLSRALLVDELGRYARARRFPKNRDFPRELVPYFIDADGTRCAAAHLMEVSGRGALAARLAARHNHSFVREIADDEELVAWADAAGLYASEIARIQPTYRQLPWAEANCMCPSGRTGGEPSNSPISSEPAEGVLETIVVEQSSTTMRGRARVSAIFGNAPRFHVGDELDLLGVTGVPESKQLPVGTIVLVPLTKDGTPHFGPPARPMYHGAAVSSTGMPLTCLATPFAKAHPLTKEQTVAAVMAPDCREFLGTLDPGWSKLHDYDEPAEPSAGGCKRGCATADGDAGSAAIMLLSALVSTIVRRHVGRR